MGKYRSANIGTIVAFHTYDLSWERRHSGIDYAYRRSQVSIQMAGYRRTNDLGVGEPCLGRNIGAG